MKLEDFYNHVKNNDAVIELGCFLKEHPEITVDLDILMVNIPSIGKWIPYTPLNGALEVTEKTQVKPFSIRFPIEQHVNVSIWLDIDIGDIWNFEIIDSRDWDCRLGIKKPRRERTKAYTSDLKMMLLRYFNKI